MDIHKRALMVGVNDDDDDVSGDDDEDDDVSGDGDDDDCQDLARYAEQHLNDVDAPLFLRFINLLINDAIYLLDEALSVSFDDHHFWFIMIKY